MLVAASSDAWRADGLHVRELQGHLLADVPLANSSDDAKREGQRLRSPPPPSPPDASLKAAVMWSFTCFAPPFPLCDPLPASLPHSLPFAADVQGLADCLIPMPSKLAPAPGKRSRPITPRRAPKKSPKKLEPREVRPVMLLSRTFLCAFRWGVMGCTVNSL